MYGWTGLQLRLEVEPRPEVALQHPHLAAQPNDFVQGAPQLLLALVLVGAAPA